MRSHKTPKLKTLKVPTARKGAQLTKTYSLMLSREAFEKLHEYRTFRDWDVPGMMRERVDEIIAMAEDEDAST